MSRTLDVPLVASTSLAVHHALQHQPALVGRREDSCAGRPRPEKTRRAIGRWLSLPSSARYERSLYPVRKIQPIARAHTPRNAMVMPALNTTLTSDWP